MKSCAKQGIRFWDYLGARLGVHGAADVPPLAELVAQKRMEMTQADLARELRVSEQTVANYEKGKTGRGPADKVLRMLFLAHIFDGEEIAEDLREKAIELMRPSRRATRLATSAGHWQADAG
jgi:transcriptional regulator with XRE-family HTH domain